MASAKSKKKSFFDETNIHEIYPVFCERNVILPNNTFILCLNIYHSELKFLSTVPDAMPSNLYNIYMFLWGIVKIMHCSNNSPSVYIKEPERVMPNDSPLARKGAPWGINFLIPLDSAVLDEYWYYMVKAILAINNGLFSPNELFCDLSLEGLKKLTDNFNMSTGCAIVPQKTGRKFIFGNFATIHQLVQALLEYHKVTPLYSRNLTMKGDYIVHPSCSSEMTSGSVLNDKKNECSENYEDICSDFTSFVYHGGKFLPHGELVKRTLHLLSYTWLLERSPRISAFKTALKKEFLLCADFLEIPKATQAKIRDQNTAAAIETIYEACCDRPEHQQLSEALTGMKNGFLRVAQSLIVKKELGVCSDGKRFLVCDPHLVIELPIELFTLTPHVTIHTHRKYSKAKIQVLSLLPTKGNASLTDQWWQIVKSGLDFEEVDDDTILYPALFQANEFVKNMSESLGIEKEDNIFFSSYKEFIATFLVNFLSLEKGPQSRAKSLECLNRLKEYVQKDFPCFKMHSILLKREEGYPVVHNPFHCDYSIFHSLFFFAATERDIMSNVPFARSMGILRLMALYAETYMLMGRWYTLVIGPPGQGKSWLANVLKAENAKYGDSMLPRNQVVHSSYATERAESCVDSSDPFGDSCAVAITEEWRVTKNDEKEQSGGSVMTKVLHDKGWNQEQRGFVEQGNAKKVTTTVISNGCKLFLANACNVATSTLDRMPIIRIPNGVKRKNTFTFQDAKRNIEEHKITQITTLESLIFHACGALRKSGCDFRDMPFQNRIIEMTFNLFDKTIAAMGLENKIKFSIRQKRFVLIIAELLGMTRAMQKRISCLDFWSESDRPSGDETLEEFNKRMRDRINQTTEDLASVALKVLREFFVFPADIVTGLSMVMEFKDDNDLALDFVRHLNPKLEKKGDAEIFFVKKSTSQENLRNMTKLSKQEFDWKMEELLKNGLVKRDTIKRVYFFAEDAAELFRLAEPETLKEFSKNLKKRIRGLITKKTSISLYQSIQCENPIIKALIPFFPKTRLLGGNSYLLNAKASDLNINLHCDWNNSRLRAIRYVILMCMKNDAACAFHDNGYVDASYIETGMVENLCVPVIKLLAMADLFDTHRTCDVSDEDLVGEPVKIEAFKESEDGLKIHNWYFFHPEFPFDLREIIFDSGCSFTDDYVEVSFEHVSPDCTRNLNPDFEVDSNFTNQSTLPAFKTSGGTKMHIALLSKIPEWFRVEKESTADQIVRNMMVRDIGKSFLYYDSSNKTDEMKMISSEEIRKKNGGSLPTFSFAASEPSNSGFLQRMKTQKKTKEYSFPKNLEGVALAKNYEKYYKCNFEKMIAAILEKPWKDCSEKERQDCRQMIMEEWEETIPNRYQPYRYVKGVSVKTYKENVFSESDRMYRKRKAELCFSTALGAKRPRLHSFITT